VLALFAYQASQEQAAMCDEFTLSADETALAAKPVNRREFAVLGAVAALVGCAGASKSSGSLLTEETVHVPTPNGFADGFFVYPGKGTHPGVVMWPDIGGLRDAFKAMARTLAASGYAVLAVNQYYRSAPAPILTSFAEWRTPAGQAKIGPMIAAITNDGIMRDATAFIAFLDAQKVVDKHRKIGSNGYCMSGPFAIRTAAAVPGRVGAAASFHGANLVTNSPDSPHLLLARAQSSFLFAIARNDDTRAPGDKDTLRGAAQAAGKTAEVVVYPADHGWSVPDSPVYNKQQADLAMKQLQGLFAAL
jgi:carboxymethylenebutenolidase